MKNKNIISKLLLLSLAASVLLQVGHCFEHFVFQHKEEICYHKNDDATKQQITHEHNLSEQCTICSFSINSFIENDVVFYATKVFVAKRLYTSIVNEKNISFYKGSLFSLRAPPFLL